MAVEIYRCRKVLAESGEVVYVPVASSAELDTPGAIAAVALAVRSALLAAGAQAPRRVAAVAGTVMAPTLADNASHALASLMGGDYLGAVKFGLPAVLGIAATLLAVLTPDARPETLSATDLLRQALAGLSPEQLAALLDKPVAAVTSGETVATAVLTPALVSSAAQVG
jgi:hypothetical protein